MPIFERVLLYAVAAACAVLLLFDDAAEDRPAAAPSASVDSVAASGTDAAAPGRASPENSGEAISPTGRLQGSGPRDAAEPAAPRATERQEIVLTDSRGRRRLELGIGGDDQPRVVLNGEHGEPVIELATGPGETGQIILRRGERQLALTSGRDGRLAVSLSGADGRAVELVLAADGSAEVRAQGGSAAPPAFLRSTSDGVAEIAARGSGGQGGPSLSVQPGGAAVGIVNADGRFGPVMHQFDDGLAELTLGGGDGEDNDGGGPSLIRTPDGTSVVSVRFPNGRPAASMLSSPDGSSVVAATGPDGRQQAELRITPDGKATFGVTKNAEGVPPAAPKPRKAKPAPKRTFISY